MDSHDRQFLNDLSLVDALGDGCHAALHTWAEALEAQEMGTERH